jgi:hypothetical protein
VTDKNYINMNYFLVSTVFNKKERKKILSF